MSVLAPARFALNMHLMAETMLQQDVAPQAACWVIDSVRGIAVSRPASVMGIINVTPDSFSDGGQWRDVAHIVSAAQRMVQAGAAWLDVGGESSRPGAASVSADEEINRVVPVIKALRAAGIVQPISIDTVKGAVARAALAAGASAINDISAGRDPALLRAAADYACPLILMHMQGVPATMQQAPCYADVVDEVITELATAMQRAEQAGVLRDRLLIDPGIGFGKSVAHNVTLLRHLSLIEQRLARPIVVGISRKSFLPRLVPFINEAVNQAAARDQVSHMLHALLAPACALLRVHDVPGAVTALHLQKIMHGGADVV
jgi:dihydropteroate synthase